jgi:hypothetical protein
MSATRVEDELLYYTAKNGDIVRQLGFSLLAAVWLFQAGPIGNPTIPISLKCPVVLAVLSMAVDAGQYLVGSALWGGLVWKGKGGDSAAEKKTQVAILLGIIAAKVSLMLLAYILLLCALAKSVKWS